MGSELIVGQLVSRFAVRHESSKKKSEKVIKEFLLLLASCVCVFRFVLSVFVLWYQKVHLVVHLRQNARESAREKVSLRHKTCYIIS